MKFKVVTTDRLLLAQLRKYATDRWLCLYPPRWRAGVEYVDGFAMDTDCGPYLMFFFTCWDAECEIGKVWPEWTEQQAREFVGGEFAKNPRWN